jgi:hypothetical protein
VKYGTKTMAICFVTSLLVGASMMAYTFNISGVGWPGASARLFVGMPGTSASGKSWRDALARAAAEWTDKTPFSFIIDQGYQSPCTGYSASSAAEGFPRGSGDGVNGADFTPTVCGNTYGNNVLAVSLVYTESNLLGGFDITEADMVFNSNTRFDIYDGPLNNQSRAIDFGRVALHELGHVIGLNHEQSSASIMRSTIGNLFTLQPDDIEGARTLYTGYANCPFKPIDFGRVSGALSVGDCSVKQLVGGGSDDSLVDAYEFVLAQATSINFNMHSASLDSVLVLMDSRSRVLDVDDDGGSGCDANITKTLAAGTYAVLANTFVGGSDCGATEGPYQITMSYQSGALLQRGGETSLQGSASSAKFAGAVKARNKATFSNVVKPSETFDVVGRINVDPQHQGQLGFIVVAGILEDGEILLRNSAGQFVPYDGQGGIIKANTKVFSALESVDILGNTRASDLGFNEIEVNFLIGYGLNSKPNELYFHSAPINLVVTP